MFSNSNVDIIGNIRVISTFSLGLLCDADPQLLLQNFRTNRSRFTEGVHFYYHNWALVWTERGAARHARMLDTDRAWAVCEKVEAGYFNRAVTERQPASAPEALTDSELSALAWLWRSADDMLMHNAAILPLLEVAGHQLAPHFAAMIGEYGDTIKEAQHILRAKTAHIASDPMVDRNWAKILPLLRQKGITEQ